MHGSGSTAEESILLPMVILGIEAEVCRDNGCHGCNDGESAHTEEESINVVVFAIP